MCLRPVTVLSLAKMSSAPFYIVYFRLSAFIGVAQTCIVMDETGGDWGVCRETRFVGEMERAYATTGGDNLHGGGPLWHRPLEKVSPPRVAFRL